MLKLVDYFVVVGYDDSVEKLPGRSFGNDSFHENDEYKSSDETKARGKIIQRFPAAECAPQSNADGNDENNMSINSSCQPNNADDYQEFDNNIHCFCQPDKGWRLYNKQEPPNFFVSVLTDIKVR